MAPDLVRSRWPTSDQDVVAPGTLELLHGPCRRSAAQSLTHEMEALVTTTGVSTMKAARDRGAGAESTVVERDSPGPGARQVRIKVQACGVCHSDALTKDGSWPGLQYPRVTGHEVAGVVDDLGSGVSEWRVGQRVGVGWHGGHDATCRECRRGDFRNCRSLSVPGLSYDGGYARNTWWRPRKPWCHSLAALTERRGGASAVRRPHDLQRPPPRRRPCR